MSWNYRMVARSYGNWEGADEVIGIHKVYYDATGQPTNCTVDPVAVSSDDIDGIRWHLDKMREALDKLTLDYAAFGRH